MMTLEQLEQRWKASCDGDPRAREIYELAKWAIEAKAIASQPERLIEVATEMRESARQFLTLDSKGAKLFNDAAAACEQLTALQTELTSLRKDRGRLDAWPKWFTEVYESNGAFYLASELVVTEASDGFDEQLGTPYESIRQAIDRALDTTTREGRKG